MIFFKKIMSFFFTLFLCINLNAQTPQNLRIDPPFWWAGMKNTHLQLLVKGDNISEYAVALSETYGKIRQIRKGDNPKYLFIDIDLNADLKPCSLPLTFSNNGKVLEIFYEIKQRESQNNLRHKGFTHKDLIYLILPDRFANGDPTNDIVKGMYEEKMNRDSMFYRHGGDIQGVIDKLDYIADLGFTAIWLNPVLENNQPFASYHGYAPTDHYKIDPRFGTNDLYKKFVEESQKMGIKVIKDLVFNHIGNKHWFYKDKPFNDWTHEHDTFTFSNFRVTTLLDPYAADYDLKKMLYGWFDKHMPDLNYDNPFLRTYLIQNSIWWIEFAGLNGFRLDTYAYSDLSFMSDFSQKVYAEYPDFNMVGEIWDNGIAIQAFFTRDNCTNHKLNTYLNGVTDFQLYHAINTTLNEKPGWNEGIEKIYYTLCSDFVYDKPFNNLIFLDNHDLSRFYSVAGEDIMKYKMAIAFLYTTRGIPMLYYGTEILMKNFKGPDEKVREDFLGGWKEDKKNKFTKKGRTKLENEAHDFVRTLGQWRKQNKAIQYGSLKQFIPEKGVYVFFRIHEAQVVMVIMNGSDEKETIQMKRFEEVLKGAKTAINIIDNKTYPLTNSFVIKPWETLVMEINY